MGPSISKSNNHFQQLLKRYKVVRTIPQQNITYLQDINQDGEDCLCRQIIVNDKTIFQEKIKEIEEKKKILDNPHVVKLSQYMIAQQKQYCGIYHKIYILFEYPHRTLEEEVLERLSQRSKFHEKQLWSIIASCIIGMSYLQKNNINHQSISSKTILIDNKGSVKVADPYCALETSNYSKMFSKNRPDHIYLSPELCKSLDNAEITPSGDIDPYKSDVFTFGMVIIEAALLKYLDDSYREDHTKVDWDTIRYYLDQIEQSYGLELKQFIQKLVSDASKRPDWLELKLHMKDEGKSTGSKNSTNKTSQVPAQYVPSQPHSQIHSQITYPSSNVPIVQNRPQIVSQPTHHHAHLHLGGISHEHRPVSQIISAQGSPKHITQYIGTRPPVYVGQSPLSHITNVPIAPSSQTLLIEITPVQPSNINLVRPALGTRPADSYITHTKIDQNLVEVSDDEDEETNYSDPSRNNLNVHTVIDSSTNSGFRPFASPVDTRDKRPNNIPPIATHGSGLTYHTTTNYYQTSGITSPHSSQQQTSNNSSFVPTIPTRYISNIPIGGLPHHGSAFTKPASNISSTLSGPAINPYRPIDTNNLFTDYQKLGIKKSDHNITNFSTQNYHVKHQVSNTNRPPSQHQITKNITTAPAPIVEVQRVVQTFSQGSRYEGEKVNGMRHGRGKFYYQDGGLYDGEWKENKMCGRGKLFYQSGKIAYDGDWENDQFTGFGILYNEEPRALNEPYNYDNFNDMEQVWTKYEGYFVDDKKQGNGKLFFSNGEYYEGNFDDDVVNGQGIFRTMDGSVIRGIWKDNYLVETTK